MIGQLCRGVKGVLTSLSSSLLSFSTQLFLSLLLWTILCNIMSSRGLKMCTITNRPTRAGLLVMMQRQRIYLPTHRLRWKCSDTLISHFLSILNSCITKVNLFEQHLECIHVMFNIQWKEKPSSWAYPGKLPNLSPVSQTRRYASSCFPSSHGCQGPEVLYIVLNQSGLKLLEVKTLRQNSGYKTNQTIQDPFSFFLANIKWTRYWTDTISTIFFLSF